MGLKVNGVLFTDFSKQRYEPGFVRTGAVFRLTASVSLVGPLLCSLQDKGVGRCMCANTFMHTLICKHKCICVCM